MYVYEDIGNYILMREKIFLVRTERLSNLGSLEILLVLVTCKVAPLTEC